MKCLEMQLTAEPPRLDRGAQMVNLTYANFPSLLQKIFISLLFFDFQRDNLVDQSRKMNLF
jgi:hypothetical protein